MTDIVWKTLVYQGNEYIKFEISNDGQLRNTKTGHVYKTCINKKGYEQVCVSLGSKNKKAFKIHKAVAETFIPNPDCKQQVNHKDCNKQNNHVDNLEWVTNAENMAHAANNGLTTRVYGVDNPQSKLSVDDVIYIREHYIPHSSEYGSRALGRKYDVDHKIILDVVKMKSYTNI